MRIKAFVKNIILLFALVGASFAAFQAQADVKLKPFVLASDKAGDLGAETDRVKSALTSAGFQIAGEYSPYKNANIIIVTNDELKNNAAATKDGGYGAIQRVSITSVKDKVQVAFTNPVYMANVYRMKGTLGDVLEKLKSALGYVKDFGADGITAGDLRHYHYKIFMPYFDEPYELGSFDSHEKAVAAVEKGLAAKWGGVSKVYRVDIPGKQQTVFGVHLTRGCSGDEYIMNKIDFAPIKSTPHLPYEMMVSGKKVYALHAKFRIAQSFPDLSMIGSNSFFSIMCAPDAIEKSLKAVLYGDKKKGDDDE